MREKGCQRESGEGFPSEKKNWPGLGRRGTGRGDLRGKGPVPPGEAGSLVVTQGSQIPHGFQDLKGQRYPGDQR